MAVSLLFLIAGFFNSLQVESIPRNKVLVYLDGDASNLRGQVRLSLNGGLPQLLEASYPDWHISSVICRQLGVGPPTLTLSTGHDADDYQYYFSTNHIQCTGWESDLGDCIIDSGPSSLLFSPKVMEVECAPPFAKDFDVMFVQPFEDSRQGIVLTYLDGRWGPVTGNASQGNPVICKEMGYDPGEDLQRGRSVAQVFAHPVIRNLTCRGDEQRMLECSFSRPNNETTYSPSWEPVYTTACSDPHLGRVKHTLHTINGNDDPSYPQDVRSSSFVSVLAIIVVMSVSLVICLRCGLGGEHSDSESVQVDLGNPSDVRHIYQRYHTGSGPGYEQVPCTVYHGDPTRPPLHSQKTSSQVPRNPQSYEDSSHTATPGRGYTADLEHHRSRYSGRGSPADYAPHNGSGNCNNYQLESVGGYHPGSGPEYYIQPAYGGTTQQFSATAFQPGSGTSYASVPQTIPDGTTSGSAGPTYGWPSAGGVKSQSGGVHESASFAPVSPERDPVDEQSDPELPSYSEAVFRSSLQF